MRKITDERLVVQNLKNLRIAYMVQTIGILAILGYDLLTKGLAGMRENPLWLVFILTAVISIYLSMSISADHENATIHPQRRLGISLLVLVLISAALAYFVSDTEGYSISNGAIIGGLVFICGLIPIVYIYKLRKKRQEENDGE